MRSTATSGGVGNTCPSSAQRARSAPTLATAPWSWRRGSFTEPRRQWASTREREGLPVSGTELAFAGRAGTSPCAGAGVAARR